MRTTLLACALAVSLLPAATSDAANSNAGFIVYVHEAPRHPYPVGIWVVVDERSWSTRRLPFGGRYTSSPHWSADGRRLLFRRQSGVYAAPLLRTSEQLPVFGRARRIAPFGDVDSVDWSPDGTAIAMALALPGRRESCTDLYTMRTNTNRPRRLTATRTCEANPAWSPDGLRIAFEREGDVTTEIVVTDIGGRSVRMLGEGTFPAWAPDDRLLAFLTRDSIAVVDAATGSPQRTLKPDLHYDRLEDGLAWSPDGTQLVHGFRDLQETFPVTHLAVIESDASDSFQITPKDTFPDMEPDWQPVCDVYGTDGDDVLTGTPGDDLICGLRGNDRIRAGGGNDTVLAGDGSDSIVGGSGADRLFGAAGNDRVYALDGLPDVVNGGPGRDRFWGDQVDTVTEVEDRRG
jgi:dipeptidyl aminopeptidase/acylaminoacyl peptidase